MALTYDKIKQDAEKLAKWIEYFGYNTQDMGYFQSDAERDAIAFIQEGIDLVSQYGPEEAQRILEEVKNILWGKTLKSQRQKIQMKE